MLLYCFKGNVLVWLKNLKKSNVENPLERTNQSNDKDQNGTSADNENIYACIAGESSNNDHNVYLTAIDTNQGTAMSSSVNSNVSLISSGFTNATYIPSPSFPIKNINNKNYEHNPELNVDDDSEELETNYSYIDHDDDGNVLRQPIQNYQDDFYRVLEPEDDSYKALEPKDISFKLNETNIALSYEDNEGDEYEMESTYTPIDPSNILNEDYDVLQF